MSRDQRENERRIESRDDLVAHFEAGIKLPEARGIGTEHEKFGVDRPTLDPLAYDGERGIGRVLERLGEVLEWTPERDQGRIVSLVDDIGGGAVTIEPGGQLELSGRVTRTIDETAAELDQHLDALAEVSAELGLAWLGAGCQPLAATTDIPWMPKSRYAVMKPFLGQRGDLAHSMMKATCTIQVNFDYVSERDAAELVQLSARLSPIVTAIFANSPLLGGRDTGFSSYRSHIWTRTDPDRCGTPPFMLDGSFDFDRYTDYLLGIPMMFVRRHRGYIDLGGTTFAEFLEHGYEGSRATQGDWELHVSTAFPDVRLKQFIEVRGADGGGRDAILALPTLWKGLVYDDRARDAAAALVEGMGPEEHAELADEVHRKAIHASWRSRPVYEVARDLVAIARRGLDRLQRGSPQQPLEARFLDVVDGWLSVPDCPAHRMRRVWARSHGDRRELARLLAF